jgi:hypothetical protein
MAHFYSAELAQQPPGSTARLSLAQNGAEPVTAAPGRAGPVAIAQIGVDTDKIARLAATAQASRLGGKGSIRRKHGPVHKTYYNAQDDRRLHQFLKRLGMNVLQGACLHVAWVAFALICNTMIYSLILPSLQGLMRLKCSWATILSFIL